ncbi:unnamed protein product, partial [Acanthoscelides obtectus]
WGAAICVVTVTLVGGKYELSAGTALTLTLYVVNGDNSLIVYDLTSLLNAISNLGMICVWVLELHFQQKIQDQHPASIRLLSDPYPETKIKKDHTCQEFRLLDNRFLPPPVKVKQTVDDLVLDEGGNFLIFQSI